MADFRGNTRLSEEYNIFLCIMNWLYILFTMFLDWTYSFSDLFSDDSPSYIVQNGFVCFTACYLVAVDIFLVKKGKIQDMVGLFSFYRCILAGTVLYDRWFASFTLSRLVYPVLDKLYISVVIDQTFISIFHQLEIKLAMPPLPVPVLNKYQTGAGNMLHLSV